MFVYWKLENWNNIRIVSKARRPKLLDVAIRSLLTSGELNNTSLSTSAEWPIHLPCWSLILGF